MVPVALASRTQVPVPLERDGPLVAPPAPDVEADLAAIREATRAIDAGDPMLRRKRALALVDKVGAAANAGDREREMVVELHKRLGAMVKPLAAAREAEAAVASVPPPRTKPTRASNGRGR